MWAEWGSDAIQYLDKGASTNDGVTWRGGLRMSTVTGAAILVVRDDPSELRKLVERRFGLDYLVEAARSVPATTPSYLRFLPG